MTIMPMLDSDRLPSSAARAGKISILPLPPSMKFFATYLQHRRETRHVAANSRAVSYRRATIASASCHALRVWALRSGRTCYG